jgi:uncharacterized protein
MDQTVVKVADTTSNPAPLGLLGFGMTTVLLNIHNAGFYELNSMILAMGVFYGGIGQVIAGIMEWRKGNTFGTTAFMSYGLFWLTLVAIWVLPGTGLKSAVGPDAMAMGWYLFMWGVFTAIMFIGTLKLSRILQFVFLSLTVLFILLAAGNWLKGHPHTSHLVHTIAGWEGILCGLSAIYAAAAGVLNDVYKRNVLPV